jgi:hypothetical protein
VLPNGAIGARFSPEGDTMYVTDATGLGIYDVTNTASPQIRSHVPLPLIHGAGTMHLADVSDPGAPAIVETRRAPGDPGEPRRGHWLLLGAITAPARARGWPDRGAPVGFYVSTECFWGAYLAPADCPPLGSWGRTTERVPLSPIGEWGRPASWGRGSVPSPTV